MVKKRSDPQIGIFFLLTLCALAGLFGKSPTATIENRRKEAQPPRLNSELDAGDIVRESRHRSAVNSLGLVLVFTIVSSDALRRFNCPYRARCPKTARGVSCELGRARVRDKTWRQACR
jgi:hypothetical protein